MTDRTEPSDKPDRDEIEKLARELYRISVFETSVIGKPFDGLLEEYQREFYALAEHVLANFVPRSDPSPNREALGV